MEIEIVEASAIFKLHGLSSSVHNNRFGEVVGRRKSDDTDLLYSSGSQQCSSRDG